MKARTLTTPKVSLHRTSDVNDMTPLAHVIESFWIQNSMKPATRDFYTTHFNAYEAFIKENRKRDANLGDLNHDYVNAYIRALEVMPTTRYPKGSPFRARAAATSLKRLANWTVEAGIFADSPLERVKKPRELTDVRQPLSDEELRQVIEACASKKMRALVIFMAGTGIRLNEAREARVSDSHLRDTQHIVRAEVCKTGLARTITFHEDISRELDKYLRTREDLAPTDPLFPTDENGFYTDNSFGKLFQRLADYSGVKRFHAHLLRHTWATNCRLAGMDVMTLKQQGGWKRWEMVERYAKIVPLKDRTTLPNPVAVLGAKVLKFKKAS